MTAFISAPARIPLLLRIGLRFARRRTGSELLPAQLLAWSPRAAIGSGVIEALAAHGDRDVDARMLQLVRMAVSFTVACTFCIGLNSRGWERVMTADELAALQGHAPLDLFGERERLAIEYARASCTTPLDVPRELGERVAAVFPERAVVILATTAAQVNYWARLIQALGCPPEG